MATTRLNGSPRELELMETQRKSLVQKIADRQVVASFDGVIVELKTSEGNSVKAADTIGTLVNLDYLTAEVEIPEKDVAKLKVGLPVILEFSASDEKGYGYVTGWPAIGELTNRGASIVRAQIRIDDYPEEILTNYSFTGKIQIEEPVENIIVEQNAITYEDDKSYVTLLRNGEKREVKVIPYGRDYVKVLEGLEGNEVLIQSDDVKKSGSKKNSFNPSNMPSGDNFGGMPGGGGGFGGGGMPGGGGRPF